MKRLLGLPPALLAEEDLRFPPQEPLGEEGRPWGDLGHLARHPRTEGQGGVPDWPPVLNPRLLKKKL